MEEAHISSSWRGAIVISILKLRKNLNLATSYRLISLMGCVAKLWIIWQLALMDLRESIPSL
jgi:hypothetical protein